MQDQRHQHIGMHVMSLHLHDFVELQASLSGISFQRIMFQFLNGKSNGVVVTKYFRNIGYFFTSTNIFEFSIANTSFPEIRSIVNNGILKIMF